MANHLAIRLDREQLAEMSCIAGVGGGVTGLVRTAQSGRPILAIDGCILACAKACLARAGVTPTKHLLLSDAGAKKRKHQDFDAAQAAMIYEEHAAPAARELAGPGAGGAPSVTASETQDAGAQRLELRDVEQLDLAPVDLHESGVLKAAEAAAHALGGES